MTIARHLLIKGHVQGVFYRAWTVGTARELGLAGWVRNLRRGDVEAVVQGDADAVARFIDLSWQGPPAARVEAIDVTDRAVETLASFEQRPTV